MLAVNGYFDGNNCVALDTSQFRPNQRLIITALDEDFVAEKSDAEQKLEAMKGFFGTMTHEEAEDIRNNRI